jgi:hypothetical protein
VENGESRLEDQAMSVKHEHDPPNQADEKFLTCDDHDRLARQLFGLRGALADGERKDARLRAALKHAK